MGAKENNNLIEMFEKLVDICNQPEIISFDSKINCKLSEFKNLHLTIKTDDLLDKILTEERSDKRKDNPVMNDCDNEADYELEERDDKRKDNPIINDCDNEADYDLEERDDKRKDNPIINDCDNEADYDLEERDDKRKDNPI